MKTCLPFLLAACAILSARPPNARAEISFGESIEWIVADSERVVIGKVVKVERRTGYEIVTIDVSKTLRGQVEAKLTFGVPQSGGQNGELWRKRGTPMLFCLVQPSQVKHDTGFPNEKWVVRPGHGGMAAFDLGKRDPNWTDVYTRDFNALTDSDAIVKYVEAYAKTIPADWQKKSLMLHVPSDSAAFKQLWRRSGVLLDVPADAQMEMLGRAWCREKAAETRAQGARVLGNFKNEENLKILKALLTDPVFSTIGSVEILPDRVIRREYPSYPSRSAAYQALRQFGAQVDQPVTEGPVKQTEEPRKESKTNANRKS